MPADSTQHMKVRWRVKELVAALGGQNNLETLCFKHGLPVPKPDTVRAWQTRGRLSSAWIGVLLVLAHREKIAFPPHMWVDLKSKGST